MATSSETAATTAERWRTHGSTTIVLETSEDGEWRASQRGVDLTGRGETAALAVAEYCRRVEGNSE